MSETARRHCLCGGSYTATTGNRQALRDLSAMFDAVHVGAGHGPATADQASRARRRADARARESTT